MLMSFASYNLWQPWQKTSPLLASTFTDYEPGIHICQVQMQSGVTGINLPRIYSVVKQSLDQDPDASWIKEQIPDLRSIDKEKIIHISKLARISIDSKKSDSLAKDLTSIFKFIEQLNEINTDKIEPLSSILNTPLRTREDKVDDGKIRDKILKNSPKKNEEFFVVPKVIE